MLDLTLVEQMGRSCLVRYVYNTCIQYKHVIHGSLLIFPPFIFRREKEIKLFDKDDLHSSYILPVQWEYQVGPSVGIEAGDHIWVSRYILEVLK
jgi:hypothetical protein